MTKIKLLINEMFDHAKEESGKTTKNGLATYLWSYFDERFPRCISDRTLSRYYEAFVEEKKAEIRVEDFMLDRFSEYIGYENFKHFSRTYVTTNEDGTTVKINLEEEEESITEKLSKIIINITNKPIFTLPEFFTKQSNVGILGVLLVCGFFAGNNFFGEQKIVENSDFSSANYKASENFHPVSSTEKSIYKPIFLSSPSRSTQNEIKTVEKQCMYWNGERYVAEFCDEVQNKLVAFNAKTAALKKITKPDTLTVENALGKVWYDKSDNKISFFSDYGVHPENGKTLKEATEHIIEKYGKQQTPE